MRRGILSNLRYVLTFLKDIFTFVILAKIHYRGDVPKRKSFIADLHCLVGAVQLDSEHLTRALHHFDIANDMAEKHEFNECHERVLELQVRST